MCILLINIVMWRRLLRNVILLIITSFYKTINYKFILQDEVKNVFTKLAVSQSPNYWENQLHLDALLVVVQCNKTGIVYHISTWKQYYLSLHPECKSLVESRRKTWSHVHVVSSFVRLPGDTLDLLVIKLTDFSIQLMISPVGGEGTW